MGSTQQPIPNENDGELLDPYDILRKLQNLTNEDNPTIPFPAHFSPTSLEQFHKCPQAFFFLYILKLTPDPPMTPELARGILCHTAIEEVFDLRPADRTLFNLENLFRRAWKKVRGEREVKNPILSEFDDGVDDGERSRGSKTEEKVGKTQSQYDTLFRNQDNDYAYDIQSEIEWGESSLLLLKNYFELEDLRAQSPLMREMWVHARLPLVNANNDHVDDVILKGKIDRIDILPKHHFDDSKVHLQIIDYKTGKKPWFKYSQSVNDRIFQDQFWKMKVYALMLWKTILQTEEGNGLQQKDQYKYRLSWELQQKLTDAMGQAHINPTTRWSNILELNSLRLIHLTSHVDDTSVNSLSDSMHDQIIGKATYLDYDLDSQSEFQSVILGQTERELQEIINEVKKLVDAQSPHAFKHCDWGYCSCHELRRKFRSGSVYDAPSSRNIR